MFDFWNLKKYKKQILELVEINNTIGKAFEENKALYERKIADLESEIEEVQEVADGFGAEMKQLKKKLEEKEEIPKEIKEKQEKRAKAFENLQKYDFKTAVMGK